MYTLFICNIKKNSYKVKNFKYILKIFNFVNFLLFFFPPQKEPYILDKLGYASRKCNYRISTKSY